MSKIPFPASNVSEIKEEAQLLASLLNNLFKHELKTGTILDGLAKYFGYTSYGDLVACNSLERFYMPFSLGLLPHLRTISASLAKHAGVSEEEILVCGSLLQLGAKSPEQVVVNTGGYEDFLADKVCLLIQNKETKPHLSHLTDTPRSAVALRQGDLLCNVEEWLPELGAWLRNVTGAMDDSIVAFYKNTLWDIASDFQQDSEVVGYIDYTFVESKTQVVRRVYEPIFNYSDTRIEFMEYVADGFDLDWLPFELPEQPEYEDDDAKWLKQWLNKINEAELQLSIQLKVLPNAPIWPDFQTEPTPSILELLNLYQDSDWSRYCASHEQRMVNGKPYVEPWLSSDYSKLIVALNNKVHNDAIKLGDNLTLFEITGVKLFQAVEDSIFQKEMEDLSE